MKPSAQALQAIETAIQIEKDGLAFYTEASDLTDDPTGKKMFHTLARDEAAHLKLFEQARQALLAQGSWLSPQEVAAISPGGFSRPPIFPTGDQIRRAEVAQRELAALERGIQAEEAAIAFYSEQMAKTDDPAGKGMYAYLTQQEEGHRTILQGEHDYLNGTGFWFDFQEFGLEGAG